jgi:hypothetical protein
LCPPCPNSFEGLFDCSGSKAKALFPELEEGQQKHIQDLFHREYFFRYLHRADIELKDCKHGQVDGPNKLVVVAAVVVEIAFPYRRHGVLRHDDRM